MGVKKCKEMLSVDDLKREYILLFQGISEMIVALDDITTRLKKLQAAAEEAYLQRCEEETWRVG